jgi:hypothetical protein
MATFDTSPMTLSRYLAINGYSTGQRRMLPDHIRTHADVSVPEAMTAEWLDDLEARIRRTKAEGLGYFVMNGADNQMLFTFVEPTFYHHAREETWAVDDLLASVQRARQLIGMKVRQALLNQKP